MNDDFADSIRLIKNERGITQELVLGTIEEFLLAAYKRTFGTSDNAVVKFSESGNGVTIYAQKTIVEDDDLYDPVAEIELAEALTMNDECEVGDELLIEIDPKTFDRSAVQSAKQRARQNLREIQKDILYSEYKDKVGEMIIGYFQRERNGTIFVDLGRSEGILPKRFQSPREEYHSGDRIKAMIAEVKPTSSGLEIILSRSHGEFIKRIFELEIPEIYDGTVEIFKIVREPGYRTKIAVYSTREDVDPVGACVGYKGVRIQGIVNELEGEKIDVLKYENDPMLFIKNALSPADVQDVYILDPARRQALAIVPEPHLSLAIGKQGMNIRLANRLADWNIDVKTESQFSEMEISREANRMASDLFSGIKPTGKEITHVKELPGMSERLLSILKEYGIELIESLVGLSNDSLKNLTGITDDDVEQIQKILEDNIEIVETDEVETSGQDDVENNSDEIDEEEEIETFECPECQQEITIDMQTCPHCGVGLSFEVEEVEEVEKQGE